MNKKLKFAILPFANTSNDEDSGFLVDGIFEDLITEFSMMREFEILSRQTSMNFKNENKDIKDFANEFSLDFIVLLIFLFYLFGCFRCVLDFFFIVFLFFRFVNKVVFFFRT